MHLQTTAQDTPLTNSDENPPMASVALIASNTESFRVAGASAEDAAVPLLSVPIQAQS